MKYIPALQDADYSWFTDATVKELDKKFVWLKYMQVVLLFLTAGLVAFLVFDVTGKWGLAHLSLWLIAFNPFMQSYTTRFYSEIIGTFLITVFTLCFYLFLKRRSLFFSVLAGIFLGLVTLTFSQWKYIAPFCLLSALFFGTCNKERRRKVFFGAFLLIAAFQAISFSWEMRNEQMVGRKYLSGRGGDVLMFRAQLDLMPVDAYLSSFFYWSYGLPKFALKTFVDRKHYVYLDRDVENGARHRGKKAIARIREQFRGDKAQADKAIMQEAKDIILDNLPRHLLVSIPIALRTMQDPMFSVFNLIVYWFFFFMIWAGMRQGEWLLPCTFAPAVALLAFNILVTHGLPRYSWQLVPVIWFGAICGWEHRRKVRALKT